ncbi:MAG: DUF721 domain-containing protein [Hyphomicrobiales bacterium]|nr:DUF721 domain-containing protein [Hyphomicrobiales bacterium]
MPPPRRKSFARPLGEYVRPALDPLVAKLGMSQATLILDWDEIAGPRLAAICQPARLRWPPRGPKTDVSKGAPPATLMLRAAPGFGLELQHLAPMLIQRVNAHLGWRCVERIALVQEPLQPRRKQAHKAPPLDPEAARRAQEMTADIEDEALRAALQRLGAAALSESARGPLRRR